ncbi:MAG: 4-hydroxyphenylacetate 3-hydroxylase N-terminal domain-containing protein [Chloroflexota bacterium]
MIRTPEQYVESLRDGRALYFEGEKIKDMTKHPKFKASINGVALSYHLANDPKWSKLLVTEEKGEKIMFLFNQPKSSEDLIRRRQIYINTMRMGARMPGMGPDALAASGIVAARIDKAKGTHYSDAIKDYHQHLLKTDPAITGAITDVKGNRGLRPSAQVQHKDFYVRIVDKKKDGIVVRGAKMHISASPTANEFIVSPCRAHREEDKDYAVVFAVPANAKGLKLITSPGYYQDIGEEADWNWPVSSRTAGISEVMLVFDDVFIPWNRVFMAGEWEFSRDQAWLFGVFHRLYGTCHKVISTEEETGAAALMAEYNGIDRYPHIQEKLAWLACHCQIVDVLAQAGCEHPDTFPDIGMVSPNITYINMAKFMFANDQHQVSKLISDIAGGIVSTVFNYKDWNNPEERPYIEKYLAGKDGIPTEDRLKAVRMVKDLIGHGHDATTIHAEGSLAAQIMSMYAYADWEKYKSIAKRVAGIKGWEKHPFLKELPPWPPKWVV